MLSTKSLFDLCLHNSKRIPTFASDKDNKHLILTVMKTINYNTLPKHLTTNIGMNVYEGKKKVYILVRAQYTGQEDKLYIVDAEKYHKQYHDLTMGDQLSDEEIKEIAEEAHSSIESVRNEVSVTAAQQYVEYNEPDATYMNY